MSELFSVHVQAAGGRPIIRLQGELTAEGETLLFSAFQTLLEEPAVEIVFDFSAVKYINSGGISILLNLISKSRFEGKSIVFCGLTRHLRKVIEIVGMDEFVQIVDRMDNLPQSI